MLGISIRGTGWNGIVRKGHCQDRHKEFKSECWHFVCLFVFSEYFLGRTKIKERIPEKRRDVWWKIIPMHDLTKKSVLFLCFYCYS